jgi:outer membrane lipoprotein
LFQSGTATAAACHVRQAVLIISALVCLTALGGCALPASRVTPPSIVQPPPGDLQLVEALARPQAHAGATVRWGGNIIHVAHDSVGNATIQIIERRLDAQGRPLEGSPSDGRFVIKASAEVDPAFFARDRLLTVFGTIEGTVNTQVGDSTQSLPVVRVRDFMFWLPRWHDDPWHYDPWHYDPWWHHGHHRYGPNVRFGVGISNFHHHH